MTCFFEDDPVEVGTLQVSMGQDAESEFPMVIDSTLIVENIIIEEQELSPPLCNWTACR